MSAQPRDDGRTGPDNQLDHFEIAARLECDAERLRLFVEHHPNPTPPVVLGWAEASPEHREVVAEWLDSHLQQRRDRNDELGERIADTRANGDGRLGVTEGPE